MVAVNKNNEKKILFSLFLMHLRGEVMRLLNEEVGSI